MKAGIASETAALVCMGRAIAHGRTAVVDFSDPTAMALLSAEQQAEVERLYLELDDRSELS